MEMPAEVINRLQALEQNRTKWEKLAPYTAWEIQSLNDASGFQVNLDHYGVTINELPGGMSAEQLLSHIRRNINDFVNSDISVFTPHPDLPGEELLWHGSPLASIIQIDMYNFFGNVDDGTVICSDYQPASWTFSTIKCPADFQHPVAGNRKFAIEQNPDGSYEVYTSGVDRIMAGSDEAVANLSEILRGYNAVFDSADDLWSSFQDKVSEFVNEHGGTATVPEIRNSGARIDYYKIEAYLKGEIGLLELRNDCD
ncbi:hypothetical protein AB9P05_04875 [Roseivirga sp. BDSF3-8]|uniref:hypothetical protein n=1 Tax=Roseivirga sp. BDSF3-8 TaxID=3241598 RepID=UPI003531F0BD